MTYRQLEEKIRVWAENEEAVRALVVAGSRARRDHAADLWSDLDLFLYVTDQQLFARDSSWLDEFGEVWLKVMKGTEVGDPEWFVLFSGGLKVDFLLAATGETLQDVLYGPQFGEVSRRGVRILVDKGRAGPIQAVVEAAARQMPEAAEFDAAVQTFWISAFRAAALIRRGELWRAREITDGELRRELLKMLAWHAQAESDTDLDTWYGGRFLEEWAHPRALAELPKLFAAFDPASTAQAVRDLLRLYAWMAQETAVHLHHPYPTAFLVQVHEWIEAMLRETV